MWPHKCAGNRIAIDGVEAWDNIGESFSLHAFDGGGLGEFTSLIGFYRSFQEGLARRVGLLWQAIRQTLALFVEEGLG